MAHSHMHTSTARVSVRTKRERTERERARSPGDKRTRENGRKNAYKGERGARDERARARCEREHGQRRVSTRTGAYAGERVGVREIREGPLRDHCAQPDTASVARLWRLIATLTHISITISLFT